MKKIFIGFALSLATLSFAQQYPNNGYGNDGYDNGYENNSYSNQDDQNYFPDDYYYNYPQDYYPTDYYQNYYNDYRNSIVNVNWNVFFTQNRLNRWQIDQVLRLNSLYGSFATWNNFYRNNPDRWYYDRYYAMERILGPRVFVTFQNDYYHGSSPIVYFQNYRRTYYTPRYRPMPRYRNVNINIYRVDRAKFRGNNNPTLNIVRTSQRENNGFRGSGRDNNSGFRNQSNNNSGNFRGSGNNGVRNNGGFRTNTENTGGTRNTGGFRGGNEVSTGNSAPRDNNGGFRRNAENSGGTRNTGGFRGNNEVKRESPAPRENSGGFRQQKSESSSPRQQNNNGSGNRSASGGFRLTSN